MYGKQISVALLLTSGLLGGCSSPSGSAPHPVRRLFEVQQHAEARVKRSQRELMEINTETYRMAGIRNSSEAILLGGGTLSALPPPTLPAGFSTPAAYSAWLASEQERIRLDVEQANETLSLISQRFADLQEQMQASESYIRDIRRK